MDNNKNLVSVIIPAYNAGKFIEETINSVLDQLYQPIEIIVVNDGSTDNTHEILQKLSDDRRIKYIKQENKGCSGAKNTGLQHATGGFIQYLDADDILSRNKIEEQVKILTNDPDGIAVCRTRIFETSVSTDKGEEIDTEFLYSSNNTFEYLLNLYGENGRNGMIQPNAFLISKKLADAIGPYDTSISPSPDEDGEYFCRAILTAKNIYYTKKGVNYYRKQLNSRHSLSKQISYPYARGALRSLELIKTHLLSREESGRIRRLMAKHFAGFIYVHSIYPDLCEEAEGEIRQLGIKEIPPVGGKNFRAISRMIGFHNALKIKNLTSSMKKKTR